MNKNKFLIIFLAFLGSVFAFSSCVKQNYDAPPSNCDSLSKLEPTYTIKELKNLYDGDTVLIQGDVTIEGNIISTDQYGNFYKKIVVQDTSGAIEIEIDDTYMFTQYPLGKKIMIKCDSLVLGDYNGILELGMAYDISNGIVRLEPDLEPVHLLKICEIMPVEPKTVAIADINDDMINTLIKLDTVQFTTADLNTTWADRIGGNTVNHTLNDINHLSLLVRTSGFASFAGDTIPGGSGSIVGVLGKYGTDYQLYIRNTDDVDMTGTRF